MADLCSLIGGFYYLCTSHLVRRKKNNLTYKIMMKQTVKNLCCSLGLSCLAVPSLLAQDRPNIVVFFVVVYLSYPSFLPKLGLAISSLVGIGYTLRYDSKLVPGVVPFLPSHTYVA